MKYRTHIAAKWNHLRKKRYAQRRSKLKHMSLHNKICWQWECSTFGADHYIKQSDAFIRTRFEQTDFPPVLR